MLSRQLKIQTTDWKDVYGNIYISHHSTCLKSSNESSWLSRQNLTSKFHWNCPSSASLASSLVSYHTKCSSHTVSLLSPSCSSSLIWHSLCLNYSSHIDLHDYYILKNPGKPSMSHQPFTSYSIQLKFPPWDYQNTLCLSLWTLVPVYPDYSIIDA